MRSVSLIPCVVSFFVSLPSRQNQTVPRSAIGCLSSPPPISYPSLAFPPLSYSSQNRHRPPSSFFSLCAIFCTFPSFFFAIYCFRVSWHRAVSLTHTNQQIENQKNNENRRLSQKNENNMNVSRRYLIIRMKYRLARFLASTIICKLVPCGSIFSLLAYCHDEISIWNIFEYTRNL